MPKITRITTKRVVQLGPDVGKIRLYEAHASSAGYTVYKLMAGPKKTEDILTHVPSLDEFWDYLSRGHRGRFSCVAAKKSAPSVLGIEEGSFLLEVAKA